jgi:hypothetical protein
VGGKAAQGVPRKESEGEVTQGETERSDRSDRVLPVISLLRGGDMNNWWVYIVEKETGLYVVMTTDLENRMEQHGQTAPLYCEGPISKADALKRERTLKS